MYGIDKVKRAAISLLFVMALAGYAETGAQGATCDEGTSLPPFLGVETVPPNLMLMIDNSGSMYDLNYVENIGYCFDDSYNNSATYAGYFMTIREIIDNSPVWYTYSGSISGSTGDMEYVRTTEADKDIDCRDAAGTKYRAADPTGNEFLCVSIDETDSDPSNHIPTYFAATGKFLNWIATSKMDVQKQVLTGGKWANHIASGTPQLVPESRGCLGRRLIKEVSVNGGAAKLSFAIRNDDNDMDGDGNYNNTVIDFHAATTGGFDNTSCQEVLTALQSPTGVGGMTTPLKDCLGGFEEKKTPEGDMISSFNLSMQDCWYMAKFGEAAWRDVFNSAAIRQQCDTLYEGNGFYDGRDPWELPEDVTALVCRGHYNDTIKYNFVGRCYVPAGHPPVALPYNGEQDEQEFQIAGMAEESGSVSGAGILPDWSRTGGDLSKSPEAALPGTFMGLAVEQPVTPGSSDSGQPLAAIPPVELKKERSALAEAVREFIRSGGRNEQARQKVLNAFYELFVAEANAAGGVVEETEATCTGNWTITSGASGGNATYSYVAGDTCTFPAAGAIFTHGLYEVSVISPCEGGGGLRDAAAVFTVNHAGGATDFVQDQKTNCDVWVKIPGPEENGTFEFLQDNPGSVVVTSNADKKTYADAVNYTIYKEILPPPPAPTSGFHPYVLQITPLTVSPTDETTVSFQVVFSENVSNFNDANDLVITEDGIPAGTLSHTGVTITGLEPEPERIYQVDITGIAGAGDISLAVKSWVRDWSENSVAGTYDEHNNFIISGPYPDKVRFGKYIVEIGPTATEVVETNLTVGFSTLVQNRSTFIDYPADITCCSGDPSTDYCCNPADYPFFNANYYTHYLTSDGWSDSEIGGGAWLVGDSVTFSIVPGSDITSSMGSIVSFSTTSAPITRVEPIPDTCTGVPPAGPSWWCDSCIEQAIIDFCGFLSQPEEMDPSDQSSIASSGEYWNVPALLWDGAISGQLDDKIGSMSVKVKIDTAPRGLVHKYADDIRFGVMGFRPYGEKSECGDYELFADCVSADTTADGASVKVPINRGPGHTAAVVAAINEYDGETWTPLAESMYTAIGYYTQKDAMRLDSGDYDVNADVAATATWNPAGAVVIPAGGIVNVDGVNYMTPGGGTPNPEATSPLDDEDIVDWQIVNDPIIAHCQRNFVLVITEGSSTADLNPEVTGFAAANSDADTDIEGCDVLQGSSYFDDLVGYAWNEQNVDSFYSYEQFSEDKNHVEVHIVDTRGVKSGVGECNPGTLLANAAENTNRVDKNGDGIADATETSLYSAASPTELWNSIDLVMRNIITQTSSGSAASVISASRSGEGALYQALFWPSTLTELGAPYPIYADWLGEVHAFFVDSQGNLREDTDQDGFQDPSDEVVVIYWDGALEETRACNGEVVADACVGISKDLEAVNYLWSTTDWLNSPVMDSNIEYNRAVDGTTGEFVFDPITPKRYIFTWNDLDNDGAVEDTEILQFHKYFDPASPLDPPFPSVIATDRAPLNIDFGVHPDGEFDIDGLGLDPCEDINRNGILDAGEDSDGNGVLDVGDDLDCDGTFDNASGVVNNIIDWVRGKDIYGMRKRDRLYDIDKNPLNGKEQITWRLGDVIHSTPISVSSPAENYHQLYRDFTYAEFLVHYQERRHVIYFGANDGMLHAMNGGFFKSFDDPSAPGTKINKFCRTKECVVDLSTGVEQNVADAPLLGAELWAYVPYNIIPHLKCLTDVTYDHKYFVDLRPRIFDVKIFNDDADHPNGWGTILVGGMRFGGSKVRPGGFDEDGNPQNDFDNNGVSDYNDNREFTSAYFILDITNPEKPPTLLAEFTRTLEDVDGDLVIEDLDGDGIIDESPEVELGFTTNISTLVPMMINEDYNDNGVEDLGENNNCNADFDVFSKWYLILGSGPTMTDGTSSRFGNVSVIPLDRFVDTSGSGTDPVLDMRIPAQEPASTDNFGSFVLPDDKSFTSDLITVDMETNKDYMADVVYFGVNSGDWATGWAGKMYRMVVRKWQECNSRMIQIESEPHEWALLYEPNTTPFMPLIDMKQPITTSPTVGTDGRDFWVYFGTGRFFDVEDKYNEFSNSTQSFYGIREPVSSVLNDLFYLGAQPLDGSGNPPCQLSWAQVLNDRLTTPTGGLQSDGVTSLTGRGGLGLMGVHNIKILSSTYMDQPGSLACVDDPSQIDPLYCLPAALQEKLDSDGNPLIDPDTGDPYTGSYQDLIEYITGDYIICSGTEVGYDGWYRDFQDARERNLGQASLLGGLLSFNSYQPFTRDLCQSEGLGYLYGVYYQTGTAWFEDIFGLIDADSDPRQENPARLALGKGLSTTPNIHVGEKEGSKAFVQTSVGKIKEIPQPNLPSKHIKSGRIKWRDIEQ